MNYGLQLSLKLEKHLTQLEADGAEDSPDECLEDRAMKMAQEEMFAESDGRWKPWCANGKSLRMGEIVLIIDADTIIPEVSSALAGPLLSPIVVIEALHDASIILDRRTGWSGEGV
jgi:hypothetical protein